MKEKDKVFKRLLLLGLVILLVTTSLWLILRFNKERRYEQDFSKKLDQSLYKEALDTYRQVQAKATDLDSSSQTQETYKSLQVKFETEVAKRADSIVDRLEKGNDMSLDDRNFILGLEEVAAASIAPVLNRTTEAWLDQKIGEKEWAYLVRAFQDFPSLKINVNYLLEQETQLRRANRLFALVQNMNIEEDWNNIWLKWQELTEDESIGRFACNYASFRLKTFQEDLYAFLMTKVDNYIEQGRYYSASLILDRLFDAFPNEVKIQEKKQLCHDKIPARLSVWSDPVEHIAIRPLVGDEAKAKSGPYKSFAESGLISCKEFEKLLEELYKNNYVLINPSPYKKYPEELANVVVPEGKKPLIMILDQYQFSCQYVESGTVEQVSFDEEKGEFYSRDIANVNDRGLGKKDAISLLEDFIKDHSDFSFDGGKAIIALTVDENILGYTVNDRQTARIEERRQQLELDPYILQNKKQDERQEFYRLQTEDLKKLLGGLLSKGYTFANSGYSGAYMNQLDQNEFEDEIENWEQLMKPLVGQVNAISFPSGSHVYEDQVKLKFLTDKGYNNMYSLSSKPFNMLSKNFIHFDATPINGNSLLSPEAWNLGRFLDVGKVIENWRG